VNWFKVKKTCIKIRNNNDDLMLENKNDDLIVSEIKLKTSFIHLTM
jgi:hypothetical protein